MSVEKAVSPTVDPAVDGMPDDVMQGLRRQQDFHPSVQLHLVEPRTVRFDTDHVEVGLKER